MMRRTLVGAILALTLAVAPGCPGGDDERVPEAPAEGAGDADAAPAVPMAQPPANGNVMSNGVPADRAKPPPPEAAHVP